MTDFQHGASPNGSPSPGSPVRPGQSFEPQSFAPQASRQEWTRGEAVAEETFARAAYPPAQAPWGNQPQAAYPPAQAPWGNQPQAASPSPLAPWDNPAPRPFSAPYAPSASWSPASTERNWMGVTSIVLACLGGGLLGIVLGRLGVVAARKGRATNARLASWGLILNVVVPLVIVGVFLAVGGASKDTNGSQWEAVAVGDCLAPPAAKGEGPGGFAPVVVACGGQHWSQVYFKGTLTGGAYPGGAALTQQAKEMCASSEALAHLDRAHIADAYPTIVVPTKESWAANDRWAVCLVSDADGSIDGSWVVGF